MKCAIYARVSSQQQAEKQTIDQQLNTLPEIAKRNNWEIVDTYIDNGISAATGKLEQRPAFQRLLKDVSAKKFDALVVADPDRITRTDDILERGIIYSCFQRAGVKIYCASTGTTLDLTDHQDQLMMTIGAIFSATDNAKRAHRIKLGKVEAIRRNRKPAGVSPFGYIYDRTTGQWSLDAVDSKTVAEIYQRIINGDTLAKIAEDFFKRNIPTPRGGIWQREGIWRIVTNKLYYGDWTVDKKKDLHISIPPIVSRETFEAAQRRLQRVSKRGIVRKKHIHLLQGLAVCELCGGKVAVHHSASRMYYVCSNRLRPYIIGRTKCDAPMLQKEVYDRVVWRKIETVFRKPNFLEMALEQQQEEVIDYSAEIAKVESRINQIVNSISAMMLKVEEGAVDDQAFDRYYASAKIRKVQAEKQLTELKEQQESSTDKKSRKDEALKAIEMMRNDLKRQITDEQKRLIITGLIGENGIRIGKDLVRVNLVVKTRVVDRDKSAYSFTTENNSKILLNLQLLIKSQSFFDVAGQILPIEYQQKLM